MNNSKIKAVMSEVAAEVAERDEMIHCIAIALLASKNIFILGDTGQAKSYCINGFRKHITDAKQFERIMSKQTDEEQLFGRLDLSSIIPGNMPSNELSKDVSYSVKLNEVKKAYAQYEIDGKTESLEKAQRLVKELGDIKEIICAIKEIEPKVITTGKIPDSHIVFLDEIFKSNDGILNSLLTALNERVYTNEGQTMKIPTISFFAASNEIPDFSEPENEILKPLYDRFDLKIVTEYVKEKDNRQAILKQKQQSALKSNNTMITLNELYAMQNEVKLVKVPNSINEIMDDILCALRTYHTASEQAYRRKIDIISDKTGIQLTANKRNGRKQEQHLQLARGIKQVKITIGEGVKGGRPEGSGTAQSKVQEWQELHPYGKKSECIKDTGLSKPTVYKWWT